MALSPGMRLGHYEILAPLGAGGMGEVYRARDTRLDRTVALKVLPAHLSQESERRQRFEREARTISSLNHPNICTLHDIGRQDGVDYLVLEHLEGESLAARLERGPLPIDQALRHGAEIADALARAHQHGVVHRDLKPANVFLTRSGAKLLDFGLAKLALPLTPLAAPEESVLATAAKPLTEAGTVLGTYPYMSPEQLEGREADGRSDVFALGAVLFEMLTGTRAFAGTSAASVIAAVLGTEPPPISHARPMAPPAVDHVVRQCLSKDPDERWQSARDVARELRWIAEDGAKPGAAVAVSPGGGRRLRAALGWSTLGLAVGGSAAYLVASHTAPPARRAVRTAILSPAGTSVRLGFGSGIALSPDGRSLVYAGRTAAGDGVLFLRRLDTLEAQPIPGTEGAYDPFWSPDGKEIAFLADERLKKVPVAGGAAEVVSGAGLNSRAGIWLRDGTLVVDASRRVSPPGAWSQVPNPAGESLGPYGAALADARHLLQCVSSGVDTEAIVLRRLDDGSLKRLTRFRDPASARVAVGGGFAVWNRGDTLVAQRIDERRLELQGEPVPIARGVATDLDKGDCLFSLSADGTLAYVAGSVRLLSRLTWFDRSGRPLGTVGEPDEYNSPELSADGGRLLADVSSFVSSGEYRREIVLFDAKGAGWLRLSPESSYTCDPVLSPDGTTVAFGALDKERRTVVLRQLGGGASEILTASARWAWPRDWSPDGRYILYDADPNGSMDIWAVPLEGAHRPFAYLSSPADEMEPAFSPDGRFVAYTSTESGRREVYVARFPRPGGARLVSFTGGRYARWRGDGRELYYVSARDELVAVDVRKAADGLEFGESRRLFRIRPKEATRRPYDVTPDGQRFVVNTLLEESPAIILVQSWAAEVPN